ncbi:hypothetical protein Aperf_G00000005411 [Anoplocephala perfoliata]
MKTGSDLLVKSGFDSELPVSIDALNSNSASTRAAALSKLSKTKSPEAPFGSTTAADLILSFCDDGDCRVRATALSCLSNWTQYDPQNPSTIADKEKFDWVSKHWQQVYTLACRLLTEDNSKVRQIALKAIHILGLRFGQKELPLDTVNPIESASLDPQFSSKRVNPSWKKPVKLVDDAFSRICDRIQDSSRFVRESAAELIADLAEFVSDDNLMVTLEKTVMSDWKVKRYLDKALAKGSVDKVSQLGIPSSSAIAKGRRSGGPNQKGSVEVDSIPLLSTGAPGAFICGLEDEFHEVRCAMLKSITKIAAHNTLFASLCQDILVDMLTDDIQSVRLLAITALQVVGDQVPILTDQITIITSALAEDCAVVRRRLHDLLARCRLASPPCLLSLVDGLMLNMRVYPEDRESIWRCSAAVGRRHPVFTELSLASLLRAHLWFAEDEPSKEDPIYIIVVLIVLNAYPARPEMAAHFPRHLIGAQLFLQELLPHLLPKEKVPIPSIGKSSSVSPILFKRPRLNPDEAGEGQLLRFLTYTVEMLRRLTTECLESLPAPREASHRLQKPQQRELEDMDTDESRVVDLHRGNCLNHLKRVVFQELRMCQQTAESSSRLGNLPHFLTCLLRAVLSLLSASLPDDKIDSLYAADVVVATPDQQALQVQQALRLTLKAEHLFLGLTPNEISAIHALRSAACRLQSSSFLDTEAVRRAVTEVVNVFLNPNSAVAAAERIRKPHVKLLYPPLIISEMSSTSKSEKKAASSHDTIPEVRFTAFLSSVSIPVRAVVTGLTLEQASLLMEVISLFGFRPSSGRVNYVWPSRVGLITMLSDYHEIVSCYSELQKNSSAYFWARMDRVRVIYRRPDTGKQHQPQTSWKPPAHCWLPLIPSVSTEAGVLSTSQPAPALESVELQTRLEFIASSWTANATLEIGLGISVPVADDDDDSKKGEAASSSSSVISLLPPGLVAKVKLHPMDSSYTW